MSVHVFRRVRCPGGSTWYSRVEIFNKEAVYDVTLRLPVCREPLSALPKGTG